MSYLAYCPSGTVFAFAGTTAPNGWLLCNGAAVSRSTYSQLYSAIGVGCGSGDGSTTFNIPDLRGRFVRGVDGGSSRDPNAATRTAMNSGGNTGNNVGSVQTGDFTAHSHTVANHNHGGGSHNHGFSGNTIDLHGNGGLQVSTLAVGDSNVGGYGTYTPSGSIGYASPISTQAPGTDSQGGSESRPINAYMNYIIKV
jgi:microcystin-dependent protein